MTAISIILAVAFLATCTLNYEKYSSPKRSSQNSFGYKHTVALKDFDKTSFHTFVENRLALPLDMSPLLKNYWIFQTGKYHFNEEDTLRTSNKIHFILFERVLLVLMDDFTVINRSEMGLFISLRADRLKVRQG